MEVELAEVEREAPRGGQWEHISAGGECGQAHSNFWYHVL